MEIRLDDVGFEREAKRSEADGAGEAPGNAKNVVVEAATYDLGPGRRIEELTNTVSVALDSIDFNSGIDEAKVFREELRQDIPVPKSMGLPEN